MRGVRVYRCGGSGRRPDQGDVVVAVNMVFTSHGRGGADRRCSEGLRRRRAEKNAALCRGSGKGNVVADQSPVGRGGRPTARRPRQNGVRGLRAIGRSCGYPGPANTNIELNRGNVVIDSSVWGRGSGRPATIHHRGRGRRGSEHPRTVRVDEGYFPLGDNHRSPGGHPHGQAIRPGGPVINDEETTVLREHKRPITRQRPGDSIRQVRCLCFRESNVRRSNRYRERPGKIGVDCLEILIKDDAPSVYVLPRRLKLVILVSGKG